VANFSMPIAHIAAKQLDEEVMLSNILRARGFLTRKSPSVNKKWTFNFYFINIATNQQKKKPEEFSLTLMGYRPVTKLIDRSCFNQHHSFKNVPSTLVVRIVPQSVTNPLDYLLLIPFQQDGGFLGVMGFALTFSEDARVVKDVLD